MARVPVRRPWWEATPQALLPAASALDGGWLVLFGRALAGHHLGRLAGLLAQHALQARLYPPAMPVGVPLLLLGTDRFSPALVQALKGRSGTSICVICQPCPVWRSPVCW